jgi:D-alanyl-D-alanine carboxypeptidase (penicillin-binding protein 5/6)
VIRITSRIVAVAAVAALITVALNAGATPRSQTPPATPVPPRGSPSPFPTALATPSNPGREPTITAEAALLADLDTGHVLFSKDPTVPRPIASVTKIMTALLTLESLPLDRMIRVDPRALFERDDYGASSTLGLRAGERISVENLLYALLLGSANDASLALAIAVDGSEVAFVRHMNTRARQLGMLQTRFASASGLDDRGHSTPRDLLRLERAAEAVGEFRTITATRFRRIPAPVGRDRIIQNRNALLWLYPGTTGTKTGSTDEAGLCLVAAATKHGRRLVAIVLDAPRDAFSSAAALLEYGFAGWEERTLLTEGEPAGTLAIEGGVVPVVAGATLEALVPLHGAAAPTSSALADPAAAFPPASGERVGSLAVRSGTRLIGRVPLVVAAVPLAPASQGPWWVRSVQAVAGGVVDAVQALAR